MSYLSLAIFSLAIVAVDQFSKFMVMSSMDEGQTITAIRGVLELTYVRNDGMAWSMLAGSRWLFVVLTLVFFGLIGVMIWKKFFSAKFELICLAAIVGGGIGNLIDRIVFGSVTDMLRVPLFDNRIIGTFPVFNIADSFVTCGCAALIIYLIFFDRKKQQQALEDAHEAENE